MEVIVPSIEEISIKLEMDLYEKIQIISDNMKNSVKGNKKSKINKEIENLSFFNKNSITEKISTENSILGKKLIKRSYSSLKFEQDEECLNKDNEDELLNLIFENNLDNSLKENAFNSTNTSLPFSTDVDSKEATLSNFYEKNINNFDLTLKFLIIGDKNIGKTFLIEKLLGNHNNINYYEYKPTES